MVLKNENEIMNILKGIAIILMVMGHAESPFNNYLYLFHLAAFIFVSGYFYNERYDEDFIHLLKNRLKSLYLPYVKYIIIFTVLNNLLFNLNLVGNSIQFDKDNIIRIVKGIITFNSPVDTLGAFWFIKTLFLCNILFGLISFIIKKVCKRNFEYYRALVITIIFLLGNIVWISYGNMSMGNIIKVSMCISIFYFGVIIKKNENKIIKNNFMWIISAILLYISSQQGKIDIANGVYTNAMFFLGNSIIGIYFLIILSEKIIIVDKYKLMNYIGKNTLPILAAHWICFRLVDSLFKIQNPNIRWIFYTVFGVLIPLIIDRLIKKTKVRLNNFIKRR
ncbi:MAG: hypothetical protein E7212_14590 [Clostridium sartagoforme]|nr:hypothetical protein [Clostridium sartagoforme]